MISGSGSANAAVVGTITIPLMIPTACAGVRRRGRDLGVDGGLIMPPMMGPPRS